MAKKIKGSIRSYRDKALGVESHLDTIEREIFTLNERQTRVENSLRELAQRTTKVQTLAISEHQVLTKLFTDLKMYLDPSDMAVAAHIALDGIWEKEITRAWLAVLKPNDTVLDIGANFGYFGLLSGQFTDKKKSKIVMFEANHKIIPYIEKSVSINWLNEQTTVENLAVSDKKGTVTLTVLKDYIGSSSVQTIEHLDTYMHEKMKLDVNETMDVASTSIDEYCDEHAIAEVNLIKMDIEGHEEIAYSGMRKVIAGSKNVTLFIEFTKDGYEDPEKFYNQMLKDFGNVYTISNEGMITKPKDMSYKAIIGDADDWVMPVFSKNNNLENSRNVIV